MMAIENPCTRRVTVSTNSGSLVYSPAPSVDTRHDKCGLTSTFKSCVSPRVSCNPDASNARPWKLRVCRASYFPQEVEAIGPMINALDGSPNPIFLSARSHKKIQWISDLGAQWFFGSVSGILIKLLKSRQSNWVYCSNRLRCLAFLSHKHVEVFLLFLYLSWKTDCIPQFVNVKTYLNTPLNIVFIVLEIQYFRVPFHLHLDFSQLRPGCNWNSTQK